MKYSLNDDRKLYDLCRKYKYQYKKFEEIKHLSDCYWSKYIKEAYYEAKMDLECTTLEIIELVLGEFCSNFNTSIECINDIEPYQCWSNPKMMNYCNKHREEHKVIIDNKELMMIVESMLMRKHL